MVLTTQLPIAISKAYSPGHITGFFSTCSNPSTTDPLYQGSIGAGFSIDKGLCSTVRLFPSPTKNFDIKLNGITSLDLNVSRYVIEQYLNLIDFPIFVSVEHETEIPIGYGLGSSGSAALSLSYALNEALKTNFTKTQSAQIAHYADIACKTGLGTVISEYTGGFELRVGFGGPGIGKIKKVTVPSDWIAVILCLAPINTDSLLRDSVSKKKTRQRLNALGKEMTDNLIHNPDICDFLTMSYQFVKEYGLDRGLCNKPLQALNSTGVKCSVALFGHTLFTLTKRNELPDILSILNPYGGKLLICGIDNSGARVLNND